MSESINWTVAANTTPSIPPLSYSFEGSPYPIWSKNIITKEAANAAFFNVIASYEFRNLTTVYTNDGSASQVDKSTRYTHWYENSHIPAATSLIKGITAEVKRAAKQQWGKTAKLAYTPQILGYEERCLFLSHCDDSILVDNVWQRNDPTRDLTAILYISGQNQVNPGPNEFSGGDLVFDYILQDGKPFVISPTAGQLIVFPSGPAYTHRVPVITKGYRVAIVTWWTLR